MTARMTTTDETLERVRVIGREAVRPPAAAVDRDARFPHEAIAAMREAGLLAVIVPREYGGGGLSLRDAVAIATELGRHCASAAMVWAMHQIQVACLARHAGDSAAVADILRSVVDDGWLLASITSEMGVGGDLRRSIAAVEGSGSGHTLAKRAPTVSYAFEADGFLVTARRDPDAAPGDQVLVFARRDQVELTPLAAWDTLGMRGTCSPACDVRATFGADQVLDAPFGEVAAMTMVPWSHLSWSACWNGIATDAIDRARAFARGKARKDPETSAALEAHLSQAAASMHLLRGSLERGLELYEREPDSFTAAIELNAVKLGCSQLVVEVVGAALRVCGMAGYSETSPYSVARHLRDAYSAPLMVSNDRLSAANGRRMLASVGV